MEQAQNYMEMARQAAEQKEHVAAVVFNGLAALLGISMEESRAGMEALIDYGSKPKKPRDRLAAYHLAQYIITARTYGSELGTRVAQLIEDARGKENAAAP